MFLATTALRDFWLEPEDCVFLGSWCLSPEQDFREEGLRDRIMPSPWDDRKRYDTACAYLDRIYRRLLPELAGYLDSVHRESHRPRYWQIMVGPWLMMYLHSFYDRYVHLRDALARYQGMSTLVLDRRCYYTPMDTNDFVRCMYGDGYNLQLFSELLYGMGFAYPTRTFRVGDPPMEENSPGSEVKQALSVGAEPLDPPARIALAGLYLAKGQTAQLLSRMNRQAAPLALGVERMPCSSEPVFNPARKGLSGMPFADPFGKLFVMSLPQNFPILFLESYPRAREVILRSYPKPPEVLVSATGWHFQEAFKFLAAEWGEKGTRLVAVQHGFGYGTFRRIPFESHETAVADRFLAWGWADPGERRLTNLPDPKLSSLAVRSTKSRRTSPAEKIVYAATAHTRYLLRFHSAPTGSQWADYYAWQCRFLSSLPRGIRSGVFLRLPAARDSRDCRPRLRAAFPDVADDEATSFHESLEQARVVVLDYPGTTFLEALIANVPVVSFWQGDRWEMREEAAIEFLNLRESGILGDSPEGAAARVQTLFERPEEWWEDDKLQAARQAFVDRYARACENWTDPWKEVLERELARGTGTRQALTAPPALPLRKMAVSPNPTP